MAFPATVVIHLPYASSPQIAGFNSALTVASTNSRFASLLEGRPGTGSVLSQPVLLELAVQRALGDAKRGGDTGAMALVHVEQGLQVRAFHVAQ